MDARDQERAATGGSSDPLEEARGTIQRQAAEIERLRARVERERFVEDLRDALALAAAAGTIGSPVKQDSLLEMIVTTAAHVIGAQAGSLFLTDERNAELSFEVAIGPKAEEVKKFRVPLGQGIAGLVAVSGQAMAVSNADEDPRLMEQIAEQIDYEPETVLCVPLFYGERVIGVLELLDKTGGGTFTPADMEALGLFANQAAVAIELSRTYRNLGPLVQQVLAAADDADPSAGRRAALRDRAAAFAEQLEDQPDWRETLELAELVQEIAWRGDAEVKACREVLRAFADYLRTRGEPFGETGAW